MFQNIFILLLFFLLLCFSGCISYSEPKIEIQNISYHYAEEDFTCPGDEYPDPRAIYEGEITEYHIPAFHLKLHSERNRCEEERNIKDFIKGDATPAYHLSGNKVLSTSFEPLLKEHFPYADWDPYTQEALEYVPYEKPLDIQTFIQENWLNSQDLLALDDHYLFSGQNLFAISNGNGKIFLLKNGYPYYYSWEFFPFTSAGGESLSIFGKIIPFYEEQTK